MHGVMNTTKWNELWTAMCTLHPRPRWRTREVNSGYVSDWDRDWFYHFRASSFRTIEWVEITTDTPSQHQSVKTVLRKIHVPADELDSGFKIYGYIPDAKYVDYL